MAEMNVLLEQAIQECEGLAAEADSFGQALTAQDGRVSDSERDVLEGARHAVHDLQEALSALRKHDAELDQHDERGRQDLHAADEVLDDAERAARELLETALQQLQELRDDRDRIGRQMQSTNERALEQVEAFRRRLERLEEEAEARLDQAEDAIEDLEGAARDARQRYEEAGADLGREEGEAEDEVERLAQDVSGAYAQVEERLDAGLAELNAGLREGGGTVAQGLHEVFDESLPRSLGEGQEGALARMEALAGLAVSGQQHAQVAMQLALQSFEDMYKMLSSMMKMMHDAEMASIRNLR